MQNKPTYENKVELQINKNSVHQIGEQSFRDFLEHVWVYPISGRVNVLFGPFSDYVSEMWSQTDEGLGTLLKALNSVGYDPHGPVELAGL